MARVVLVGWGVVGLCAAQMLGRDGHQVTVLERDSAPPTDPEAAWNGWERRGVNQFRMLHYFAPRDPGMLVDVSGAAILASSKHGADARRFLAKVPVSFTLVRDGADAAAKGFDVKAMPSGYLIDRKGVVRVVHRGFTPETGAALEKEIDSLLKEPS
jgi:flavin-dependent dehydrogenase